MQRGQSLGRFLVMDLLETPTPHVNPAALAHVVDGVIAHGVPDGPAKVTRTFVAERLLGLHLSNLAHLIAGRRSGEDTLTQIAVGLSVPVGVLACWCDRPDGRCRNGGGS